MKNNNYPTLDDWFLELSKKYQLSSSEIEKIYEAVDFNPDKLLTYLNSLELNKPAKSLPKITIFNNGILVKDKFYDFSIEANMELFKMLQNNEFDREVYEEVFGVGNPIQDILIENINEFYHQSLDLSDLKRNIEVVKDNSKRVKRISVEQAPHLIYKFVIGKGKVLKEPKHSERSSIQCPNPTAVTDCNLLSEDEDSVDNQDFDIGTTDSLSKTNFSSKTLDSSKTVLDSPLPEPTSYSPLSNELIGHLNERKMPESIVIGDEPFIKFKIVYKNKETLVIANPNFKIYDLLCHVRSLLHQNVSILLGYEILDENESIIVLKHTVSYII